MQMFFLKVFKVFKLKLKKIRSVLLIPQNKPIKKLKQEKIKTIACLIATKNGLYLLSEGNLFLLLDGEFYGISKYKNTWYIFQKLKSKGRVLRFILEKNKIKKIQIIIDNLSIGCHQIDFINHDLYVADTYNNRILVYTEIRKNFKLKSEHYPVGQLKHGRQSENYAHINSLWKNEDGLYLVFHNETSKTGKKSEVLLLDMNFAVQKRMQMEASHAHNVVKTKDGILLCDSMNSQLLLDNKIVFKTNKFLRGLSITDNFVMVGGSDYGERENRENLKGAIFILDTSFKLVFDFKLPGMVHEIRSLNTKDYTLSDKRLNTD